MKRVLALAMVVVMMMTMLLACSTKEETKNTGEGKTESTEGASGETKEETLPTTTKVVLNEVAHSIFYAPMYVAIEEGYFDEEGIELELVTGFGENMLVQDKSQKINALYGVIFVQVYLGNGGAPESAPVFRRQLQVHAPKICLQQLFKAGKIPA